MLDLVATGFNKPPTLFGHTMRSKADIEAAADAFKAHCLKVRHGMSCVSLTALVHAACTSAAKLRKRRIAMA